MRTTSLLPVLVLGAACRSGRPLPQAPSSAPSASATTSATSGMPTECPCGATTRCVPTTRAGERCLQPCKGDADCGGDGWSCDARWGVCGRPGLLSPRLAVCGAPPLPPSGFTRPIQVTGPAAPGLYQFEPTASATATGDVVIAFATGTPMFHPFGVATVVVHPDGSASAPQPVHGRDSAFDPWMASDPRTGTVALVWLAFDGARAPEKNPGIALTTTRDGTTWAPTRYAHDPRDCAAGATGCFDKPMVAWGPRGELYVFYETDEPAALKVVKSTDGGATFSPAVQVAEAGYGDAEVDASGVLHVIAGQGPSGTGLGLGSIAGHFVYARSDDGGASFATSSASADGESVPGFFSNPQVVSDDARKLVYVAYPRGSDDGRWDIVLATSRDAGKTWSRVQVNDDAPCASHAMPQAALDPRTGDLHVAWLENRTGRGGVAHARCDSGGARCSSNDAVSDAPFASYELLRFSPKWMGEYGALFVDARRSTLDAVWTQTVADGVGGSPAARIFLARKAL